MTKYRRALLVATALLFVTAIQVAAQQPQVVNLQLSDSAGGPARAAFPTDTTTVYVGFDYRDTANTAIAVVMEGMGLTDIYYQSDRYSGTGHADVPITGADVFGSLTYKLSSAAEVARSNAKKARDASSGGVARDYLLLVESQVIDMATILDMFDSLPLDAARSGLVRDLSVNVEELMRLSEEAGDISFDQLSQLQAKARDMDAPAEAAVQGAAAIEDGAGTVGDVPIPPTGDAGGEYTIQLQLVLGTSAASPAAYASFTVLEVPDTPANIVSPGAGKTATSAPTQRSSGGSQPTATPSGGANAGTSGNNASSAATSRAAASGVGATVPSGGSGSDVAGATIGAAAAAATSAARLGSASAQRSAAATAAESSDSGAAGDGTQAFAALGDEPSASGGDEEQSSPMPTWTVPPGQVALAGDQPQGADMNPVGPSDSGGGSNAASSRNLLLLAVGVIALIGVAVWMRGRM